MAQLRCAGASKILLDWAEKASVVVVASLAVSLGGEGAKAILFPKHLASLER
jgi:hypothetical protein